MLALVNAYKEAPIVILYNPELRLAQPIASTFGSIMAKCIANAADKSDQKSMIMTAREDGWLSDKETKALIDALGLVSA